jgi:hypothetical protein
MYEEHFQEGKIVEFLIEETKFGYKPTTAGQENDWLNEYMIFDGKGNASQDISKLNKCKIRNLVQVPYNREIIKKVIGIDKDWQIMDNDEKWMLMSQLKPTVFSMIIKNINDIDNGTAMEIEEKKD